MEEIILSLYSSLLVVGLLLASPTLLLRPKTRAGLKEKLGFVSDDLKDKLSYAHKAIWIHAVSVGEFNGAFPLIQAIKVKFPRHSLIVSTTTKAGHAMAQQRAGHIAQIIYFPFDLPWVVERMLDLIKPTAVIIFETELWPNFISFCRSRAVPIILLNARMSPRSFKGYSSIQSLVRPLLNKLTLIGAQTEIEARSYRALAGGNVPIKVLGNTKYDWLANIDEQKLDRLRKNLGIGEEDLVLVAGSTHAGEEQIILDVYKRLKNLKVVIAPRHPERFDEVAKIIETEGFRAVRHSQQGKFSQAGDIYVLDAIGLLADYYALGSVAFVGGSLAKIGGHNLLEPYLYAVPVVCGPHLDKTKETATILSDQKALLIGNSAEEVKDKLVSLLENASIRGQMGKIGQLWLNNNRGAVERSLNAISPIISSSAGPVITKSRMAAHMVNPWQKLKANQARKNTKK